MSANESVSREGDDAPGDLGLLGQVLGATRDATRDIDRGVDRGVVKTLVSEALKGTVSRDKDISKAIQTAIDDVERDVSSQLARILHHPAFQALEASWRGLFELIRRGETDSSLAIKVLNVSKDELRSDLGSDTGPGAGRLGRLLTAFQDDEGEVPFAVLLDDHDITGSPEDVTLLGALASVASSAECLLVAAGSPTLCGLGRWVDLTEESSLGAGLDPDSAAAWDRFRKSAASQDVILAVPRILARRPYGEATSHVEELPFEELGGRTGGGRPVDPALLTWMSPAFVVGAIVNDAFAQAGRDGVNELFETGARIGNLICFYSQDEDGDPIAIGPVEVVLDRHRDTELRELGFTPLQAIRNSESAALNGFRTPHRPAPE